MAGTRAARLYEQGEVLEEFWCNYGVNRFYQDSLQQAGLTTSGLGDENECRIVELAEHPFFVGTLFLPQKRSEQGRPHPLLRGFAAAVTSYVRSAVTE